MIFLSVVKKNSLCHFQYFSSWQEPHWNKFSNHVIPPKVTHLVSTKKEVSDEDKSWEPFGLANTSTDYKRKFQHREHSYDERLTIEDMNRCIATLMKKVSKVFLIEKKTQATGSKPLITKVGLYLSFPRLFLNLLLQMAFLPNTSQILENTS